MNPIERLFTAIIQQFLELAVTLVRGLFGGNIGQNEDDASTIDEVKTDAAPEIEDRNAP